MSADPALTPVLESLAIHSPLAFAFGEEPPQEVPAIVAALAGVPSHPLPQDPLVFALQAALYQRAYVRAFDDPGPEPVPGPPDPDFMLRLARFNRGRDRWDPAWEVYETGPGGQLFVRKGDRHRTARPGEYAAVPLDPRVSLRAPRDSFVAQPGFYYMFGETLPNAWDEPDLVRFYFHSTAAGVCSLIEFLTTQLNRYLVPYRMKTLTDPGSYGRADGTVLYVTRDVFQIVARIAGDLPAPVAAGLRPRVPLFTWRLRPGVGVAEEPNNGESFGMHRCRLAAEGIVEAWKRGRQKVEDRIEAIRDRFALHGLHLERPYLNPGSTDYFPAFCPRGAEA